MGTINFAKSEIVTLGTLPGSAYLEAEDDLYSAAREILSNYYFYYYHIAIKPGYYEGFYIDIENNFSYCYQDYDEKREAQKELTQLKKCLLELAATGLASCYPGWCTGYAEPDQTKTDILEGIKSEREYIKTIPTWYNLRAAGEI